jgi:hypothetical protein
VIGGVSPVVLPPTMSLMAATVVEHGNSVAPMTALQPIDLPTIFFSPAAPPVTFALPTERLAGVLDGLATLSPQRPSLLDTSDNTIFAVPPTQWIAPGQAFSVRLPGVLDGDRGVLQISLADGRPLPSWLHVDPFTDTLDGVPPAGFNGTLSLQMTVLDGHGQVRNVPLELSSRPAPRASSQAERPSPEHKSVATAKPALQAQFGQQRQHGNVDHAALLHHLAVARQHVAAAQVHP